MVSNIIRKIFTREPQNKPRKKYDLIYPVEGVIIDNDPLTIYLKIYNIHRIYSPTNFRITSIKKNKSIMVLPLFLIYNLNKIYNLNEIYNLNKIYNLNEIYTIKGIDDKGNKVELRLIGSFLVNSVILNKKIKENSYIEQADEIGYFNFGSTVILNVKVPKNFINKKVNFHNTISSYEFL